MAPSIAQMLPDIMLGCWQMEHVQGPQAFIRIKDFFENQSFDLVNLKKIQYVMNSLGGVRVDHCQPGFGKNVINSTSCTGCCIPCPPGKFSAKHDTMCTSCAYGSFNKLYGQAECRSCPKRMTTNRRGATFETECHRPLDLWIVILISAAGASLFLVITWCFVRKCCRRTLAGQYVENTQSELKQELKRLANVINDIDLIEVKNRLKHPMKRRKSPKHKVDVSDDPSVSLLSASETSVIVDSTVSPGSTAHSEFETSFVESTSEYTSGEEDSSTSEQSPPNPRGKARREPY
nr:PREDICTED: uncharacterized protein LOC106703997 [Latimeria chalumnae]|eukprot:XP_014345528.1 PREDICTED: uncharacterized protein LOC106703997 [Latimeria chalumnae]